jgi:small GTP-binding protein
MNSTVVARLTPQGAAALSTFAVLGPRAEEVVSRVFRHGGAGGLVYGRPMYGWFGEKIKDDVVVVADDSGIEVCIEISCHGGAAITEGLIADVVDHGAERVEWRILERRRGRSEFQCDALEALSTATTERSVAILLDQLNGALDRALEEPSGAAEALRWSSVGRLLLRPARVVLYGLPNAGKSTLFNAIAGYSRVITNPVAGTTRDVISETISLDGWPIELVDGAGFHDDASPLEAEGARRLTETLASADLRILVVDASTRNSEDERLAARILPHLRVANKIDLIGGMRIDESVRCSALTGAGIVELKSAIVNTLIPAAPPPGAAVPFRESHRTALAEVVTRSGASAFLR